MEFMSQMGFFLYPLLLCSIIAAFICFERFIALRDKVLFPHDFISKLSSQAYDVEAYSEVSLAGRLLGFFHNERHAKDEKMLKAFVQLELGRLERGLYILEVVTGIAPLIGLLGTVFGLTNVFGTLSHQIEFSDPTVFVSGIALALNTTILGLLIAIPCLAMHSFFQRRIDIIAQQLEFSIESLLYNERVNGYALS